MVNLYEESLLIRDQISSLLLSVSPILLWNSYVPQSPLILFRHCHCLSHFQIHPTGKVQFGFIVLMFSMRRLIPLKRSWTDCCVFYDTALRTICSNCFRLLSSLTLETACFWDFFFKFKFSTFCRGVMSWTTVSLVHQEFCLTWQFSDERLVPSCRILHEYCFPHSANELHS